ncbi:MAG: hypothetical protein IJE05_04130 [Clostridia bacterium]|nr:hypothetical protein [Clostridia bacterium]
MLNIVWPGFIIISVIFAILSGNLAELNNSIFESTSTAVNLSITLLGTMCLWSGIMKIASRTSAMQKITNILAPIMKLLFPKLKKDSEIYQEISMNMVANILGLGNAATPLGIKAMKSMQENNSDKKVLTNEMVTLIVLNTASIQIIPTTVIAIRNSLGSENPTAIIVPVWIATICAAVAGIVATKIFIKLGR